MKLNSYLVKLAASYVKRHILEYLDHNYLYHNLAHTIYVVNASKIIASFLNLDKSDRMSLELAAWFHDLGFIQQAKDHESLGAKMAEEYLFWNYVDKDIISIVNSCIYSTGYSQRPKTLIEQILCDADLTYLGDKQFLKISLSLRKEWELTEDRFYTDVEWQQDTLNFLSSHQFHTSYCRNYLSRKKEDNINRLIKLKEANLFVDVPEKSGIALNRDVKWRSLLFQFTE